MIEALRSRWLKLGARRMKVDEPIALLLVDAPALTPSSSSLPASGTVKHAVRSHPARRRIPTMTCSLDRSR
jgi:hypothetical protein